MSYFTTRPRSISKPAKDEVKLLVQQISQHSEQELRQIIELAVTESSETARVFAKILSNASNIQLKQQFAFQPVQPQPILTDYGLPTPVDSAEDSEMSGTENATAQLQHCQSPNISRRSNKRKSLADMDDNVPSFAPRPFATMKKRRPEHESVPDETTSCGNCGRNVPNSCWNQFETCVYHPGTFEKKDAVLAAGFNAPWKGQWSCCHTNLTGRGCFQSKHRSVEPSGKGRTGFLSVTNSETQFSTLFRSGRLPLVQ